MNDMKISKEGAGGPEGPGRPREPEDSDEVMKPEQRHQEPPIQITKIHLLDSNMQ